MCRDERWSEGGTEGGQEEGEVGMTPVSHSQ